MLITDPSDQLHSKAVQWLEALRLLKHSVICFIHRAPGAGIVAHDLFRAPVSLWSRA